MATSCEDDMRVRIRGGKGWRNKRVKWRNDGCKSLGGDDGTEYNKTGWEQEDMYLATAFCQLILHLFGCREVLLVPDEVLMLLSVFDLRQ
jgi:hypothetical protein